MPGRKLEIKDVRFDHGRGPRLIAAPAWAYEREPESDAYRMTFNSRRIIMDEVYLRLRVDSWADGTEEDFPERYRTLRQPLLRPTARALKTCIVCERLFFGLRTTTCTEKCAAKRRKATHVQSTKPRRVTHEDRPCQQCGESFTPRRSDARFCSGRCRVAHHRLEDATP